MRTTTVQTPAANAPNLDALPGASFLTRNEIAALTGFTSQAFKVWSTQKRGPRVSRIEGHPRYRVADVRAWLEAQNG